LFKSFKGARKEPTGLEEPAMRRKGNLERVKESEILMPHPLKEHLGVGCVTNWYQSMVTTLGLLGLMDESLKKSIWSTFKRVTLYLTSFLKVWLKMLLKKRMKLSTVCVHLRN
jgi:hypothetical protein